MNHTYNSSSIFRSPKIDEKMIEARMKDGRRDQRTIFQDDSDNCVHCLGSVDSEPFELQETTENN